MGENMKKYFVGIFCCVLMLFCQTAIAPPEQTNQPESSWNMSGAYAELEIRGQQGPTIAMVWIPVPNGDTFIMQLITRFTDGQITNLDTGEQYSGDFAFNTFMFKGTIESSSQYCMHGNALFFRAGGKSDI